MKKLSKRILAITLCLALLASTVILGGAATVSEEKAGLTSIDLDYGETYTFDFSEVKEYKANTDSVTVDGGTIYPLRSKDSTATAKQATITVGEDQISALELSANNVGMYIPTDKDGIPLAIEPNSTYKVVVSSYRKALVAWGQIFFGGGIYQANLPEFTGHTETLKFPDSIAWGNSANDLPAYYPVYRTKSHQYAGNTAVYNPEYNILLDSVLYFNTGDYDANKGVIELLGSDGEVYDFATYFGMSLSFGNVNTGGYKGDSVIYIDSISVTKTAGMDIGESYTFDFDKVVDTTANTTALVDGEGNTFYPFHSDNTGDSYTGATIDVTKKDGSTGSVSALKIVSGSIKGNGYSQYIPTDENGLPFIIEPNTKYTVSIDGYIQKATTQGQIFFGAGAFHSDQAAYGLLNSGYNGAESWYYIDGTSKGKADGAMVSGYPMYRGDSMFWRSVSSNFTGFNQNNTAQYYEGRSNTVLTTNFTENVSGTGTVGTNHFKTDLWQRNKFKTGTTYPDPYTTDGVTINSESVGAYLTINCGSGGCIFYLDKITVTKESQTATVSYDANGGKFSASETAKTVTETVGDLFSVEDPVYADDTLVFGGWSLSADSKIAVKDVDGSLNGKTLYAIWKEPSAHPENGVYDTWSRVVEFEGYNVSSENSFTPTGSSYGQYSGVPYFHVIDDPTEDGNDKVLHYYNHSGSSWWYPNWTFNPTADGTASSTKGAANCTVLSTSSTYKLTLRLNVINLDGGKADLMLLYTVGKLGSATGSANTKEYYINSNITETNGEWVDVVTYFTTPAEFPTVTNGLANRVGFLICKPGVKVEYMMDTLTLEKVTTTNFYVKENGNYVLLDTAEGVPGTELTLPTFDSKEEYSDNGPTGYEAKVLLGNWYADEECTKAAVPKFGNYDVDIYCDSVTPVTPVSTKNQEMFVGFDTYIQRTEGLSGAAVSNETSYTGDYALKAKLAADKFAAFELKNDHTLDVADKTYRADFMYKASAEAKFEIGLADSSILDGITPLANTTLAAADEWTKASVTFTADNVADTALLGAKLSANTDATVYIDTIIVSSATESVAVEAVNDTDLRFMFSYSGNNLVMAGESYAVAEHGVLVKGEDNNTLLNLENKDNAGVFYFSQTDMAKNWSVNPITGSTVYSALISGFEIDDEYKAVVRGYIKLSDGTVFYSDEMAASVTDIPAAADIIPESADLSDYYVYLPEGTTFPADKTYSVSTYNTAFAATNALENNTITEGSYVSFSAKPDFEEIDVPSEVKYLVHAGAKAELYAGLNAQIVSEKINSVGASAVNYLFITDIHFGDELTSARSVSLLNQAKLITKMANENDNIDFVVIGGDTTTGMYNSKADAIKWTQAALDPFLKCTKPVFVLMGNHDDNSYHYYFGSNPNKELYKDNIITDLDWQNNIIARYTNKDNIQVVQDDPAKRKNSKYFYYDLVGKKTRVVALDALDYEAKYDVNGYVLGDTDGDGLVDGMPIKSAGAEKEMDRYYHGCNYWGYSADQTRWLAEDALGTLPADYDVIFVSHMGIDYDTNCYKSKVWFGDEIRDVLKAYNAGETYTASLTDNWGNAVSVNADFADKNGKLLAWQFGHQHIEMTMYSSDINLFQFCTSSANVGQTGTQTYEQLPSTSVTDKNLPWRVYTRKMGTSSEVCFNAMSLTRERIYRLTVGAGNNEKLVYPY
ncbi:MAG: metallophosphoesterase [Acutalibacteraceae bacterium]|nr:metallophosphoesterase [Acutalibacteraceae bacterium]